MNAELLLAHFNRISDAPDAVTRMRRFILDLAVRGKLVEQDPGDEPASELLVRIRAEKARIFRTGKARSMGPLSQSEDVEVPFPVPPVWEWTRIRQVTSDRGQTIPKSDFTYIDVTSINREVGCIADGKVLAPADAPSRARKVVKAGDVLYSCVRPYLLNIAVVETEIVPTPIASTAFAVLNGFGLVIPKYLWIALRSPYIVGYVEAKMRGQAYPAINDSDFAELPFPLPPLAEQHRIAAKVSDLMALCDRLEAAQREREIRRDRLTAATHHHLNNGADAGALRSHAQFFIGHLPHLTARPDQIKQLRQTILNLAVRGKLVPQDHFDDPVVELLDRIHREQDRLIKNGAIPKRKFAKATLSENEYFDFPMNWSAVKFDSVCNIVTSGSRGWAQYYSDSGPRFIRAQNIRFGKLRLDDLACVNPPTKSEGTRTQVSKGDLLIVITGAGVTNPAMIEEEIREAYVSQHVALVKPTNIDISPWLLLFLMADTGGRAKLVERAYGAGKPGLNLDNIRSLTTPLPPLAEQHRIVAKVDELMALCDQLESRLTTVRTAAGRLLESVLHNALNSQVERLESVLST